MLRRRYLHGVRALVAARSARGGNVIVGMRASALLHAEASAVKRTMDVETIEGDPTSRMRIFVPDIDDPDGPLITWVP